MPQALDQVNENLNALGNTHVADIDEDLATGQLGPGNVDTGTSKGLAALNAMITDQATMIAYIDDFRLMMVMTLVTIPFLLLIRGTRPQAGEHMAVAE